MMNEIELIYRDPMGIGQISCFWCRETQSTMMLASLMYRDGMLAVRTEFQHTGRGRGIERRWHASAGKNLLCTLAVPCVQAGIALQLIPLAAGCAVAEVLESAAPGMHAQIKWPNDVMVSGKKIAGILCEAARQCIFIGIGVNVNETEFAFTGKSEPSSLYLEAGSEHDLGQVYQDLLQELPPFLSLHDAPERIRARLYGLGRKVEMISGAADITKPLQGMLSGIADDGALVIDTSAGREYIYSGEITRFL